MNNTQKQKIQSRLAELTTSMPPEHMMTKLMAKGILSIDDSEEIDTKMTDSKKNSAIINKVLKSAAPDAYDIFLMALESIPNKSNVLARMVDGSDDSSIHRQPQSDMHQFQRSTNHNIGTSTASQSDESTNSSNTSSGKVCRQVIDGDGRKLDIYISNPDSTAKPYINIIYRKVGPDWKALARELNFDNSDIKKIVQSNAGDIDEQCADMLGQFYKSKGSDFTKLVLVKALFSSGLRSVAEIILDSEI